MTDLRGVRDFMKAATEALEKLDGTLDERFNSDVDTEHFSHAAMLSVAKMRAAVERFEACNEIELLAAEMEGPS